MTPGVAGTVEDTSMIAKFTCVGLVVLSSWMVAGCATAPKAHKDQEAAKSPDPSGYLVDDSSVTVLMDSSYYLANLAVKNTSNAPIVATLEWDGGLGSSLQYTIIVYPHATTDTGIPLTVLPQGHVRLKVIDAQWQ
jgi:hypothetical protein